MYMNRDEFLLLSRRGRVPRAVRTGPPTSMPPLERGRGLRGRPRGAVMRDAVGTVRTVMRDRSRGRRQLDPDACRVLEFPERESVSSASRSDGDPER